MVEVYINDKEIENGKFLISIQGHANSGKFGQDLVCAGVSTIAYGILNYFSVYFRDEHVTKVDERGNVYIRANELNEQEIIRAKYAIEMINVMFITMENSFPQYVKIKSKKYPYLE